MQISERGNTLASSHLRAERVSPTVVKIQVEEQIRKGAEENALGGWLGKYETALVHAMKNLDGDSMR